MSSAISASAPSERVGTRLLPFRRRAKWLASLRIALVGAVVLLALLLAFMWLDLIWAIPASGRWVITRIGLLVGLTAIAGTYWWRARRATLERLALEIDTRAETGGEVLAGWQLETRPPARSAPLTLGLARLASARASERLAAIPPASVLPGSTAKKAGWMLCGAIVLMTALSAVMPSIASNQWQRFLFPARDVPPYTGVVITVEPAAATVRYGDDLTIQARVTAGQVGRMQLVTVTPDGQEHVLPMLPQQADQWQAILTRVTSSLEFYARSGRSRSQVGRLKVQLTPEIVSATVRIVPPAYTRRATYEGPVPKDGIVGLAGTEVEFIVGSNRPLRSGQLLLAFRDGTNERVAMVPADASAASADALAVVRGTMRLTKPGRFDLSVVDVDDVESIDRLEGSITIGTDQRPVVRILEPKPMSLATPDVRLPVVIAAEDDYGITSLLLYRSLNGSAATPMTCTVDGRPRQNVTLELPLDRYGLQPGDEIQLFARTEDNDPAGVKGAESPVTTIHIISTRQFQEMVLQQQGAESLQAKYRAAERYLERLADAIRQAQEAAEAAAADPDSPAATQNLHDKLAAAREAAAEAAQEMEKLAQHPLPIDVDEALVERLAELAQQTDQAARELRQMTAAQGGDRPLRTSETDALRRIAEQVGQRRHQLNEQAIEPLKKLQQAMPLIVDQQRFIQLTEAQRDLARRLDSLRAEADQDDPQVRRRVADLEIEQQMLRESLDNLLRDIEAHAEALPADPEFEKLKTTSMEFAAAVRGSEALAHMAAAQLHLLGNQYAAAAEASGTAADILESFIGKCNAMGQGAGAACELAFNPALGAPGLGNSIQQLLSMLGTNPGAGPGMGFGAGMGGGYSMRSPGPQNVGMYGSLPFGQPRPGRGRGDRQSPGLSTNAGGPTQQTGRAEEIQRNEAAAGGQSYSTVPAQYRSQVAEYFRRLTELLGDEQ